MRVDAYVGLGSNVEPERHLTAAFMRLEHEAGRLRASSVYRGPAIGFSGNDFLNAVVCISWDRGPDALNALLREVERAEGRTREPGVLGSRTLDLDLLLYGRRVDPARRLPRPDVLRYAFVLAPLAEVAPDLRHPLTGETMAAAWERSRAGWPALVKVGLSYALAGSETTSPRFDPHPLQ